MARKLQVEIVGDASGLSNALRNATGASKGFGQSLKRLAASAAGIVGIGVVARSAWGELKEGQEVSAQTAAALESTGGAANVAARDVEKLAQSISNMSGIDDEAVQAGENMLLTFTSIRNEVGKGNDIFNQATLATANLATRMKKDMPSAALLVGKALNQPVKGVTALTRAGVQFTQAQKDQIAAMVASGNVMGAQKIILGELETQFGGSAKAAGETLPGKLAIARNAFDNLAASILGKAIPAIASIVSWIKRNQTAAVALATGVGVLVAGLVALRVARAAAAAMIALNIALATNPVLLIVAGIAALAAGLVVAWRRSETFRNIVKGAFEVVKTVASAVSTAVKAIISAVQAVANSPAVGVLRSVLTGAFNVVKTAASAVSTAVKAIISAVQAVANSPAVGVLRSVLTGAFNVVKTAVSAVSTAVKAIISAVQAVANNPVVRGIGNVIGGAFTVALAGINAVISAIQAVISAAGAAKRALASGFSGGNDPSKTVKRISPGGGFRSRSLDGFAAKEIPLTPGIRLALAGITPDTGDDLAAQRAVLAKQQGDLAAAAKAYQAIAKLQAQIRRLGTSKKNEAEVTRLRDAILNRTAAYENAAQAVAQTSQAIRGLESEIETIPDPPDCSCDGAKDDPTSGSSASPEVNITVQVQDQTMLGMSPEAVRRLVNVLGPGLRRQVGIAVVGSGG